ncbi:MAG: hypothetical protein DWQ08_12835 [Proteobacteria bacterium]|nr:MAG: hypothetical protein DWQ08_12835 [Pseudomonadota bacterium]
MTFEIVSKSVCTGVNIYSRESTAIVRVRFEPSINERSPSTGRMAEMLFQFLQSSDFEYSGIQSWVLEQQQRVVDVLEPAAELRETLGFAVELQNLVGPKFNRREVQALEEGRFWDLVVPRESPSVAFLSIRYALLLLQFANTGKSGHGPDSSVSSRIGRTIERFLQIGASGSLDQTTRAVANAATRRGIPWHRLTDEQRLVRLGHGYRQRRIFESMSDGTSVLAVKAASNKWTTGRMLADFGLPVPGRVLVGSARSLSVAAERLGYPLVVKPLDAGKGRGVSSDVSSFDELVTAFGVASKIGNGTVLVESFLEGQEYRILVVDDAVVAVARRDPASVIGDGSHTVEELVRIANRDERRGNGFQRVMTRIPLDSETDRVLSMQGLMRRSVPSDGATVMLRKTSNVSTGGKGVDVTENTHPSVKRIALEAVRLLGLNVAGVDYISKDITKPWKEAGGGIIEVNQCPGLRPHWSADDGARDVVGPIVESLFPDGATSRIPVAMITGSSGSLESARLLEKLLSFRCGAVGLASSEGLFFGDCCKKISRAGDASPVQTLMDHPKLEIAVLECTEEQLTRHGVGIDKCNVAAITSLVDSPVAMSVRTAGRELVRPAQLALEIAAEFIVLNADDRGCIKLLPYVREGCKVIFFAEHDQSAILAEHLAGGGAGVMLERLNGDRVIALIEGAQRSVVHPVIQQDAGSSGSAVVSVLAAVSVAWAMGISAGSLNGFFSMSAPRNADDDPAR